MSYLANVCMSTIHLVFVPVLKFNWDIEFLQRFLQLKNYICGYSINLILKEVQQPIGWIWNKRMILNSQGRI